MYIPDLRFRLPLFLPDFHLNDLRELDLPMPILNMDYVNRKRSPAWLPIENGMMATQWGGHGPVPVAVRRRFPDK